MTVSFPEPPYGNANTTTPQLYCSYSNLPQHNGAIVGKELTSPLRRRLGTTPQAPQARCKAKITSTLGFHICRAPSSDGLELQLVPQLSFAAFPVICMNVEFICKIKIMILVSIVFLEGFSVP